MGLGKKHGWAVLKQPLKNFKTLRLQKNDEGEGYSHS
jgi:hypothetical protein